MIIFSRIAFFSHIARAFVVACFAIAASTAAAQTASANDALFQDLGGKDGIEKIVNAFLPIVLADTRINDAFKDTDMERLAALLAEQFCDLGGGPCKYSGKNMREAHADMAVTRAHFNALAEDLQLAMEQQGIAPSVQNRLIAKLAPMQRDVVTK